MNREILIENDYPATLAFDRSARTVDADGRLHVSDCILSVAEISPYMGHEIPGNEALGLQPDKLYRLYRDAAALEASAPTFENMPLMSDHIGTSSTQPQKALIAGAVSNVRWKAPRLIGDIAVWDAEVISGILDGSKRGLSCGYHYVPDMTPGTFRGERYDGRMIGPLVCNHVALVSEPRVPDAFVADGMPRFESANVVQQLRNIRDRTQRERENSALAKLIPGYYRI